MFCQRKTDVENGDQNDFQDDSDNQHITFPQLVTQNPVLSTNLYVHADWLDNRVSSSPSSVLEHGDASNGQSSGLDKRCDLQEVIVDAPKLFSQSGTFTPLYISSPQRGRNSQSSAAVHPHSDNSVQATVASTRGLEGRPLGEHGSLNWTPCKENGSLEWTPCADDDPTLLSPPSLDFASNYCGDLDMCWYLPQPAMYRASPNEDFSGNKDRKQSSS